MSTHTGAGKKPTFRVCRDDDADLGHLHDRSIVVIGYGKQGRAQALNLKESGARVTVASIRDSSAEKAEADGFRVVPIEGSARGADILMLLVPDEVQRSAYEHFLSPDLGPGPDALLRPRVQLHFGHVRPPREVDVVRVAPRMIGAIVRTAFERGAGVPAYVPVGRGSGQAHQTMLAIAEGIGCTRAGVVEMTFEDETVLDLFLEQTLMPIFSRSMLWGSTC